MVTIKEMKTNRELKEFIKFPMELFKDNQYFTPDLIADEMTNLRKDKNPAFDYCEAKYFMAYKDGKAAGRIAAILSHKANEKWDQSRMRFSRVDFIDDDEVVDALFNAVTEWAKEKGCDELHGPIGFCDLDKEGMLIEGFEEPNMFITWHAFPYYKTQMERAGFSKAVDWIEYRVFVPNQIPEKLERLADVIQRRNKLTIRQVNSRRTLRPYIEKVFHLINEAYGHLYGVVELTQRQIDHYVDQYLPFLDFDFIKLVEDKNGELCAFCFFLPELGPALKKAKGALFPLGWYHLLRGLKTYDVMDMALIAVRPDMQNLGITSLLMVEMVKTCIRRGVKYAETGPELETNDKVQALWKHFDAVQHKRRRCWIKRI